MAKKLWGFTPEDINAVKKQLNALDLSPKQQRRVIEWTLQRLKKDAQKNVTHQRSPDGKVWEKRKKKVTKKGKKAQKMLKRGAELLSTKIEGSGRKGTISYQKIGTAIILNLHHIGAEIEVTQSKKEQEELKELLAENKEDATPKQIKKLKELGYTTTAVKNEKGKVKIKKVTKKNITRGRAGLIIRYLEEKKGIKIRRNLKSYKLAQRQFLDENEKRNAKVMTEVAEKVINLKNK